MCPNCRAFITSDDRTCPYCEVKLGPRAIDIRKPDDLLGGLIPHARFLTVVLLVLNSGIYAATMLYSMKSGNTAALTDIDRGTLILFGAKFNLYILNGHWWRLLTAGFLHAGIMHILMNMWAMFDLGANVEEAFGTSRFITIYVVATMAGFWFSYHWSRALSVGASAGIFGLLGAMIAFGTLHSRSTFGQMIKTHYSRWAFYGIILGILLPIPMDNAAHIGGLAGGFGTAWVAGTPKHGGLGEKIWNAAAALSVAVVVAAFAEAARFFLRAGG